MQKGDVQGGASVAGGKDKVRPKVESVAWAMPRATIEGNLNNLSHQ